MIGKPPHTSLNDHKRLRCFARSFRALGVRQLLLPTFSHRGTMQACGLPRERYSRDSYRNLAFRRPTACTTALRKAQEKWRREHSENLQRLDAAPSDPHSGTRHAGPPQDDKKRLFRTGKRATPRKAENKSGTTQQQSRQETETNIKELRSHPKMTPQPLSIHYNAFVKPGAKLHICKFCRGGKTKRQTPAFTLPLRP